MRAVVHDPYGPPDVLRLGDVDRPVPKDDEVLIKVRATTVSRTDVALRAGEPFVSRFITGVRKPKRPILGGRSLRELSYATSSPNHVVSASRRPASVPSPTHDACPSGRTNTAVGALTSPSTGSSHIPAYEASTR